MYKEGMNDCLLFRLKFLSSAYFCLFLRPLPSQWLTFEFHPFRGVHDAVHHGIGYCFLSNLINSHLQGGALCSYPGLVLRCAPFVQWWPYSGSENCESFVRYGGCAYSPFHCPRAWQWVHQRWGFLWWWPHAGIKGPVYAKSRMRFIFLRCLIHVGV